MACNQGDSEMEESDTDCDLKPPPRHRSGRRKSDDELLSKLEEQNRLLTSDVKTVTSIPGTPSKRLSACGEVISLDDSSIGTPENYEEVCEESDLYLEWGQVISSWNDIFRRKPKNVKNLVRKGIPNALRGMVWQLLCGARDSPLKEKYPLLIKTNSACERMIKRDIARTFPDHSFFKDKDGIGQGTLFNVIKAYSVYDKEVGYCQGSAFIVGILLMQMPEEEAFCVFVKLMQEEYRMREIFKPTMAELGLCIFQLESMLQEQLPELHAHFQAQGFHTAMYASSWFLTLFAAVLPLNASFRVMDIFISEGREGLLRIIIALLTMGKDDILQLDMEGLLKYFQKDMPERHEKDMDALIQAASRVKISSKKLKKLEKEYTRVKHKEAEDNEEIRRQKTENRLLMQRVEYLEKESADLADRLIQGQVTLAEQQEEVFVLKRDLLFSKRHDADTSAALLEANTRIEELTMFKNHIVSELAGRTDNTAPSKSDLQRIALEAEVEEQKIRELRLEQQVNKLSKRVQELENELYLMREEVTPRYPQVTFNGAQNEEHEPSEPSNEIEEKQQTHL